MVPEPNPNTAIAKKFKQKLGNIKISSMRLFGSRAKGNFTPESDFDFLIISNDFKGIPPHKRAVKIYPKWEEDYPLELICLTEAELEQKSKNQWSIAYQAVSTGIPV